MLRADDDSLALFHPLVRRWFRQRVGEPTAAQSLAWPEIAAGRHVLITAPTGSGKTLAAFLWALDRLLTGAWPGGGVRVLYVSPLKALNNDIQRNLLGPLADLEAAFAGAGERVEEVRVATRSGDTPGAERQRMVRRPPEILITTPESLNILLTSKGGRSMLDGLVTAILDEVHAVFGSKRGTHLITAIDRLVPLAGEFQRMALSATVRPVDRIARFVGGFEVEGVDREGVEVAYRPRQVRVVRAAGVKRYDLGIRFCGGVEAPGEASTAGVVEPVGPPAEQSAWDRLVADFRDRIRRNRSTLLFANSRRLTEKITRLINEGEVEDLVYSHHGSLSREIRQVVEERLKQGLLAGIVATNSLELGIDIGELDEVLLVQTPPSVASALQRIGRAGHRVGEVSRARFYPTHGRDLLDAAVVARAVVEQEIEEMRPVEAPLDVLAQVIVSMTAAEIWEIDALFRFFRSSYPYRNLGRREFDLVLEMLAGRYADTRLRELRPRISLDRLDGTVRGRPGVARLVYMAGGTIPDRGYFHLRLQDSMARVGELDEEFVWERSIGDTFTLGTQTWRIRQITHNDVLVSPRRGGSAMAPFWRADRRDRGFELSERIGRLLEVLEGRLAGSVREAENLEWLRREYLMEEPAARELLGLLCAQREATGCPLPHRHHLVAERATGTTNGSDRRRLVLHTFWGGRVNRPLALALAGAWEKRYGYPLEVLHDDDCLIVAAPDDLDPEELFALVGGEAIEELIRERLERTGFFGARFRECAGRALLLPRSDFRRRQPLWVTRQRSKKLLQAVSDYGDFPILLESWRTCLDDEFELEQLRCLLAEVEDGTIRVSRCATSRPSPFAANLMWMQTNRFMYESDAPEGGAGSAVSRDLLQELVFSSELRPRIPSALIERLQQKLHRTSPGYAPQRGRDLLDWVKERLLIPVGEWRHLLEAIERDAGSGRAAVEGIVGAVADKLVAVGFPGAEGMAICALESLPRLLEAVRVEPAGVELAGVEGGEAVSVDAILARAGRRRRESEDDPLAGVIAEWVRFYGPFKRGVLSDVFGLEENRLLEVLESLVADQRVVIDHFRQGADGGDELEVCDGENLERLLRMVRAEARPSFESLPLARLPLFLASFQGLTGRGEALEDLRSVLDRLFGYPAPARSWETDLLPARLDPYYLAWLDRLMQESELVWFGCGRERLSFSFAPDLCLFRQGAEGRAAAAGERAAELFADPRAKLGFGDLLERTALAPAELAGRLWDLAWRGEVSNTTFLAVRRALLNRFQTAEGAGGERREHGRRHGGRPPRRRVDRWQAARPEVGDWYALDDGGGEDSLDALDREELNKERVRVLLDRYGVLFRELLERELPALRWSRLFRSLRLMELSGEAVAGRFFDGLPGLQFASPVAFRRLRDGLNDDAVYWMSAVDPASPCGLAVEELKGVFPARLPSNHLVFHGDRLVAISRRSGASLEIRAEPDHPHLPDYLQFLKVLLTREFSPVKGITVEMINGVPAAKSPFARRFAELFSASRDHRQVKIRRRYGS